MVLRERDGHSAGNSGIFFDRCYQANRLISKAQRSEVALNIPFATEHKKISIKFYRPLQPLEIQTHG